MLSVFGNLRINSPERLQHLKDSFESFSSASDDWFINIRGACREEAMAFLRERLGSALTEFCLLNDARGWIPNALDVLSRARHRYILIWNEDHLNVAPPEAVLRTEAFSVLALQQGTYIDSVVLTKERWQAVLDAGYPYYLLSLLGIYKKPLFEKLLHRDRYKLPLFLTSAVLFLYAVTVRGAPV